MNRFTALRAGYGILLLAAPGPVFRLYTGHRVNRVSRVVVRILGARQLAQGIVTVGNPGPVVLALGVQVDLAHVASMLTLAVIDRRLRRAGLVDAVAASVFAVTGAVLAVRAPALPRGDDALGRLAALRQTAARRSAHRTLPSAISRWLIRDG